jgi:radical SAM protein with 4Fe4S-binding SPASM domain
MESSLNLSVQWHITTNCSNRCRHCYMFDSSTYRSERDNTLSYGGLLRILDDIECFEKKWNANIGHFAITGGDPLLRKDWGSFLRELKKREKTISLMGNPETLTETNLNILKDIGISSFQMSLDGLEKTHDYFRSPGSFKRTVNKLDLLKKNKISTNIMFTLYPGNKEELIPLLNFVVKNTSASSFSFDIGCFVGHGKDLRGNIDSKEVQDLFLQYITEKEKLKKSGYKTRIAEKSNFLKLTRFERGEFPVYNSDDWPISSGCLIGWHCIPILSDGTVLACRRMPLKIGKMPEQSFEEIFLGNEFLKKFRRRKFFKKCGNCDFYQDCRGCPANVYSQKGDPFAENDFCFSHLTNRCLRSNRKTFIEPDLKTNYKQEFDYIASSTRNINIEKIEAFAENDQHFRTLFLELLTVNKQQKDFLSDPKVFLSKNNIQLEDLAVLFLIRYFSENSYDVEFKKDFEEHIKKNRLIDILLT